MVIYRCGLTDSTRWDGFEHRPGDIVLSIPSKCGTTWAQMICALLVFGTPELPAPLTSLSPWLDMRLRPLADVRRDLAAQRHRRFIKTHTPLDGLPLRDDVTYVIVGRDPRDVAVSMHHHRRNFNPAVIPLTGAPLDEHDGTRAWLFSTETPQENLSTLRGALWHLRIAWELRGRPNVLLLHYSDLTVDLIGGMRRLSDALGIDADALDLPALAAAASFDRMRARATDLVPDERINLLMDSQEFFRRGGNGAWRDVLGADDLRRYTDLLGELAPPDLRDWLHPAQV